MNGADRKYLGQRMTRFEEKLDAVHDDVLVLKTQKNMATKVMYTIAGIISLSISVMIGVFRG